MQKPIIEIEKLSKRYGRTDALRAISFSVKPGTFLTILGPNGSGKTTLIRILATLSRPSAGTVSLFGLNPEQAGPDIRRNIGVVSHASFLDRSLTAEENLAFYGRMFQIASREDTIEYWLNKVGLYDRRSDLVRTFSRGMLQRLSLARALLHHPQLLLLDEPYAALDAKADALLRQTLALLRHEGRTIVLTTHHWSREGNDSDSVAVLMNGRLRYVGPPSSIVWNDPSASPAGDQKKGDGR